MNTLRYIISTLSGVHYVLLRRDVLNFCLGFSENLCNGSQMRSPVPSSLALFQFSYHFFVSEEALALIICQQNKKENKTKPKRPNNTFFFFFFKMTQLSWVMLLMLSVGKAFKENEYQA